MSLNYPFSIGDYVVCPGHGVGQVVSVEEKNIGASLKSFYIIKVIQNGMTVMVPVDSKDHIRNLAGDQEITQLFNLLSDHKVDIDQSTWNRRHRDYMGKIKTGSLLEIAEVMRALFLLKYTKTLSFGERKLLEQCKALVVKELSVAKGESEITVSQKIESFFSESPKA